MKEKLNLIWQIPYTVWVVVSFFIFAGFSAIIYFLISVTDEKKVEKRISFYNKLWMNVWGNLCGIRQKVLGLENIDYNQSYVITCNHTSNMDTMIFPRSNSLPLRPLAKAELKKIPILGYLFKKAAIYVDRSSKESRKASMDRMRELIKRNVSIFIFPEGTRNKTDEPLKSFYDGAFKLAIETGIPVLPVVMTGAQAIMSHERLWMKPGKTQVIYLEPVPSESYTLENVEELKQTVFERMKDAYLKYSKSSS